MSNHTQGPWYVSRLGTPDYAPEYEIYAGSSGRDLARVIGANADANARLIKAAPKLYDLVLLANDGTKGTHTMMWQRAAAEVLTGIRGD